MPDGKITGIIFDLDGVICSTDEYHYLAWKQIADEIGAAFDRTTNARLRGVSRMESLDILLETYSGTFTADQKNTLADKKNAVYQKYLVEMSPASLEKDVKPTLEELRKRGYALAIGSSSKNTPLILKQIGLGDFFDAVADGNGIKKSKPDPEVFLLAAKLIRKAPENCLVIEDAAAGIEAAKRGGMSAAAIGYAATLPKGAMPYEADYVLHTLGDLLSGVLNTP
jgi:beta-phosphoglucomutase